MLSRIYLCTYRAHPFIIKKVFIIVFTYQILIRVYILRKNTHHLYIARAQRAIILKYVKVQREYFVIKINKILSEFYTEEKKCIYKSKRTGPICVIVNNK